MSEFLCRKCGSHYTREHTCSGSGNFIWVDSDKIEDLNDQIVQLTAELKDWKADAERLATSYVARINGKVWCRYCGILKYDDRADFHNKLIHALDCPITLHRQLREKYEVKECHE